MGLLISANVGRLQRHGEISGHLVDLLLSMLWSLSLSMTKLAKALLENYAIIAFMCGFFFSFMTHIYGSLILGLSNQLSVFTRNWFV